MKFLKQALILILLLSIAGCVEGTTGGTETGNTVGAAVASLFGKSDQSALISLLIREARAQAVSSACDVPDQASPDILISASVKAGTYGVPVRKTDSVTLTEADGCDHKDTGGKYEGFDVARHSMNCTDGSGVRSSLVMTGSGVFTQDSLQTSPSTQIFGGFNITDGLQAQGVNCHITLVRQGTGASSVLTAVCTDNAGNSLEQAKDTTCTGSY